MILVSFAVNIDVSAARLAELRHNAPYVSSQVNESCILNMEPCKSMGLCKTISPRAPHVHTDREPRHPGAPTAK